MHNIFYKIFALIAILISASACSTGIEKTKPITMSKYERKSLQPTPEETFMSQISSAPLKSWQKGKKFLISDNKALLVFDPNSSLNGDSLKGTIISFTGISAKTTPGGSQEAVINFTDGKREYAYSSGKSLEVASESLTGMDIPMLIDLDLVKDAGELLIGKKVWTRSQLWYKQSGERMTGRKFVPVTITAVSPGSMVFPLRLDITDDRGEKAMLYMNIRSSGVESRTFENMFSLSDPKLKYPAILPEVWEYIQNGRLKIGMTKEECKLSVGNPSDVNSGHDWNSTLDMWKYSNGAYLQFQDGLLVRYRM